jgi:hypothetical protein
VNRLFFRRGFQANILAMAMLFPAMIHPQSHAEVASLDLPDAPRPQGSLAIVDAYEDQTTSGTSSSSSIQAPSDQTAPATASNSQKPMTDAERKAEAEAELQRELRQRMAGIIPNFNAVLDGSSVPLTPGQKMRAAFRSAVDPYQFALAGFTSLIGQAENSHSSFDTTRMINVGYSQGIVGYSQRFGASFTDQFDGTIIGNGIFPILFHQDARYYRKGTGPKMKRALYAASTAVMCKGDNGKWQPNFSNVLGNLAAGGISNLYYPAQDRGFALTMEQGVEVTAEGIFGAELIEFYPDIKKHFRKHKDPIVAPAASPATTTAPKNP